MHRPVCPELYPDPRPSRLFAPLLPYLSRLVRLLPWLAALIMVGAVGLLALAAVPLLTWAILTIAVFAPIAAGAVMFNVGWD